MSKSNWNNQRENITEDNDNKFPKRWDSGDKKLNYETITVNKVDQTYNNRSWQKVVISNDTRIRNSIYTNNNTETSEMDQYSNDRRSYGRTLQINEKGMR